MNAPASPSNVPPRLLFVPVSGPFGTGEYVRSLTIASAAGRRWPDAEIHFLLSRAAPYAADAPFGATLLPSSPTFNTPEVIAAIDRFRPDIVIFDNAGRTAQLRAAHRAGAAVVFISRRRRQRRRASRLRWLRLLDEHWIAFPRFIAGGSGPFEAIKRRLCRRPAPRYLDVVLPQTDRLPPESILAELDLDAPPVLVIPGGGTGHPNAPDASARFRAAAAELAAAGALTVYIGPGETAAAAALRAYSFLPQCDLVALMRAARLVITNGGTTLLQAIACGAPCVAVPIAKDQPVRIRRAAAAGVAVAARLEAAAIASAARRLLDDEKLRLALVRRVAALELADGAAVAVEAIASLLAKRGKAPRAE